LIKAESKGWAIHEVPVIWNEDPNTSVKIVKTAVDDMKGLSRVRSELKNNIAVEKLSFMALLFGTLPKALPPFSSSLSLQLGGIAIASQSLWVLGATFSLLVALHLLSHRTLVGKAMEASSTDPLGADLAGISRNLMVFFAFGVSAAMGSIAGVLVTPLFYTSYNAGTLLGLKGFIAAVLGGWGKNSGAILGGFALGIVESVSVAFIPAGYKDGVAFVILLLILYFRPKGILGSPFIDSRRW
jgi:branched-chain amino acid transport system permease protein